MNKPSRRRMLAACSEIGPDDGVDPRYDGHANAPRGPGHKALQLCRQVAEALDAVFAGCGDEVLNGLCVASVKPNPHAGRLLVTVASTPSRITFLPFLRASATSDAVPGPSRPQATTTLLDKPIRLLRALFRSVKMATSTSGATVEDFSGRMPTVRPPRAFAPSLTAF